MSYFYHPGFSNSAPTFVSPSERLAGVLERGGGRGPLSPLVVGCWVLGETYASLLFPPFLSLSLSLKDSLGDINNKYYYQYGHRDDGESGIGSSECNNSGGGTNGGTNDRTIERMIEPTVPYQPPKIVHRSLQWQQQQQEQKQR